MNPEGKELENELVVIGGGGAELIKTLARNCQDMGVEIRRQAAAQQILTSRKGKKTGVSAGRRGERFTIATKSIVIAIGGFGGNKALLKKYCPEYRDNMVCFELLHKGDGLEMAFDMGAAGMDTGGWVSETYYIKLSGYAFGYAVNSGRIAGENAAGFALAK